MVSTDGRRHLLPIATAVVALVTAALVALAPLGSSSSCTTTELGSSCTSSSTALLETEGGTVLAVLVVPAVLALVGVLRPTRLVLGLVAWLLLVCCALGALSIGVFFLPTLAVAITAAARA